MTLNHPVRKRPIKRTGLVSLRSLIEIFFETPKPLGEFRRLPADQVPEPFRGLLAHTSHMTVTVEAHHGESVDVRVLRSTRQGNTYSREILLQTQSTQKVVQYGIVRLHLEHIAESPRQEILEQRKPLGRILIEHDVLREIELFDLLEVRCGPVLAGCFGVNEGTRAYGRTAIIYCDGQPAIELLEIVTPS
jgi:chorismate-pyruvate lyase